MSTTVTQLGLIDYIVFGVSLSLSAAIGFYYYFASRKQQNNHEYLHASKSMSVAPVAVSLMASFMSAITLLGEHTAKSKLVSNCRNVVMSV